MSIVLSFPIRLFLWLRCGCAPCLFSERAQEMCQSEQLLSENENKYKEKEKFVIDIVVHNTHMCWMGSIKSMNMKMRHLTGERQNVLSSNTLFAIRSILLATDPCRSNTHRQTQKGTKRKHRYTKWQALVHYANNSTKKTMETRRWRDFIENAIRLHTKLFCRREAYVSKHLPYGCYVIPFHSITTILKWAISRSMQFEYFSSTIMNRRGERDKIRNIYDGTVN